MSSINEGEENEHDSFYELTDDDKRILTKKIDALINYITNNYRNLTQEERAFTPLKI